jgi:DNA-binding phage protein
MEQHRLGGPIYNLLFWTLQSITICTRHNVILQDTCPYCGKEQPIMARKNQLGYCSSCKQWLGFSKEHVQSEENCVEASSNYHIWAAQSVGELFAVAPYLQIQPNRENIRKSLSVIVNYFSEGSISAFAKQAQLPKSHLGKWISGEAIPQFPVLLRLCHCAAVSLRAFLLGELDSDSCREAELTTTLDPLPINKAHQRYCRDRAALEASLCEDPPPSLTEIAVRLGYRDTSRLYAGNKGCSKKLVRRRKRFLSKERSKRTLVKISDPTEALSLINKALQEEPPPSVREVARRLGYNGVIPFRNKFPEQYRHVLARITEFRRMGWDLVRQTLADALHENPPPTLHEISKRSNGKSITNIKKHWPHLIKRLYA